jgi:hypothetical protein
VALVAGAVATGIGGDHGGPAAATAETKPQRAGVSWQGAGGFTARPLRAPLGKGARIATRNLGPDGSVTPVAGKAQRAVLVGGETGRAQVRAGSAQTSSPTPASGLPSQVSGLASTVEQAAQAVLPAALPVQAVLPAALPVQAPSLPPVHVDLPKIPGGTPLP